MESTGTMWWVPTLSFIGALAGGVLAKLVETNASKIRRLQDAYVAFAGAVGAMRHYIPDAAFVTGRKDDDDWIRFEMTRAQLLILEKDATRLAQIEVVRSCVEDAYSVIVHLGEDEVSAKEERRLRSDKASKDTAKLDTELLKLLTAVRQLDELAPKNLQT